MTNVLGAVCKTIISWLENMKSFTEYVYTNLYTWVFYELFEPDYHLKKA